MKIAIEGCCHGELDIIYETLLAAENELNIKFDLLICCGDFQAIRNNIDLNYLACPPKYRKFGDFLKFFNCEKSAPILTIFVGGNHEAPNVLKELYYGGWVAPNLFYLGHSGVIKIGEFRICGLSGIYKQNDYNKGHFEFPPFDESTKRSSYHIRKFEIEKLKNIKQPIDIIITHDWPRGIEKFGNWKNLIKNKKHFAQEIHDGVFGNPVTAELLDILKPKMWFSAHLHTKFSALYPHTDGTATRFLALDKVIPGRSFLQFLEVNKSTVGYTSITPNSTPTHTTPLKICYDEEWLAILKANQANIPLLPNYTHTQTRKPTEQDINWVTQRLSMKINCTQNNNFCWPNWDDPNFTDLHNQRQFLLELLQIENMDYFNQTTYLDIIHKKNNNVNTQKIQQFEEEIEIDADDLLDDIS